MSGGTNDTQIILGLVLFMILTSFVSTMLQSALNIETTELNVPNYYANGTAVGTSYSEILTAGTVSPGIGNVLQSIMSFITGVYSWYPLWLNLISIALRLVVVFIIYRALRSGSG